MNIFQKLLKITEEVGVVAKNFKIDVTKTSSYKAVSEADVLERVKPIEIKYGVYSYPLSREVVESRQIIKVFEYNGNKSERAENFMRIKTIYRFVNVDEPTEFIDIDTYGDGIDSGDKAPGKAMTYADKYGLLKAYKIQTGEDPDKQASGEYKPTSEGKQPSKTKTAPQNTGTGAGVAATVQQLAIITSKYSEQELGAMLQRMNKEISQLTVLEASKMIEARKG